MPIDKNLIFKEKGYPFHEKNQDNGLGKRDPNNVDVQSLTDVMSEEAKEQFDANAVDVQKFDAPNTDDEDKNIKLPCNDKQLASQPSTKDVDVQYGYINSNKNVQSCKIFPNVKNEEPD